MAQPRTTEQTNRGDAQYSQDAGVAKDLERNATKARQAKITQFFPMLNDVICRSTSVRINDIDSVTSEANCNAMQPQTDESEDFCVRYLPLYYQNVRSTPARTDLRNRIKLSLYKGLCFTETQKFKRSKVY